MHRLSWLKPIFVCFVFAFALFYGERAESQIILITLSGKGQLLGGLPDTLTGYSSLRFQVPKPKEDIVAAAQAQLKKVVERSNEKLKILLRSQERIQLLTDVYGITRDDLLGVAKQMENSLASGHPAGQPDVPVSDSLDTQCYSAAFPYFADTVYFPARDPSRSIRCVVRDQQSAIDFMIRQTDPFKKLAYRWLVNTKDDLKVKNAPGDWRQLKATIQFDSVHAARLMDSLTTFSESKKNSFATSDNHTLHAFTGSTEGLSSAIDSLNKAIEYKIQHSLQADKKWILEWLWYAQDKDTLPALNPFPFGPHESYGPETDLIPLAAVRDRMMARDSYIRNPDFGKLPVNVIDTIIEGKTVLSRQLKQLKEDSARYAKNIARNDSLQDDFVGLTRNLNNGIFFLSPDSKRLYFMRHHDARSYNVLMNDTRRTAEYLEEDRVTILAHNLLQTENETIQISMPVISGDGSLAASTVAGAIKLATGAEKTVKAAGAPKGDTSTARVALDGAVRDAIVKLRRLLELSVELDYLANQYNPMTELKEKIDKDTLYHSVVLYPPNRVEGPRMAKYYITRTPAGEKVIPAADGKDTKGASDAKAGDAKGGADGASKQAAPGGLFALPADTFSYRINKLYSVFPMIGLAYTVNNFNDINTDTTGHQSIASEAQIRFIVGMKVYLRKTDIRNNHLPWEKDNRGRPLWMSRISVNAAIDVAHPMNNLYGGASLDIVPGASVGLGAVFNRYTYLRYNGGQEINNKVYYRPGFYASLTTDLTLVASLLKLVNL
jgi:hypothetical protein